MTKLTLISVLYMFVYHCSLRVNALVGDGVRINHGCQDMKVIARNTSIYNKP